MPCCGTKRVRVNHEALISRKLLSSALPWMLSEESDIYILLYFDRYLWFLREEIFCV